MPRLGVNIDHIATLRQARGISEPDPLNSVPILLACGVEQLTCHLREDRRHIQDHDLARFVALKSIPINFEMAATSEMIRIARKSKPHTVTLVPEKRKEITTEGGLDLKRNFKSLSKAIPQLKEKGIRVSLFIDPDPKQVDLAIALKADAIELHTGTYCEVFGKKREAKEFDRLKNSTARASEGGLSVFAGHGLNTDNLLPLIAIPLIEEYNIGHSIIGRAVFIGLEAAIREIQAILKGA